MNEKKTIKIALCQMGIEYENIDNNLKKMEHYIRGASNNAFLRADLILFPEMTLTGFTMNTELSGAFDTVSVVKQLAVQYKIAIGFGWVEGTCASKNHYSVVNENGEMIADYVKIHPFSYDEEDVYFVPGGMPCTFEFKGITIGIAICYDLRFPELFQYESKNAHMIIVPANWPERRTEHWNTLLKARAIENQVYMVGVNCVGNVGGRYYCGDSQVVSPNGDIIFKNSDKEFLKVINITDDVDRVRKSFPVKMDRKEALYAGWYS